MDVNAVEIERIYVLQAYHGKKVGQLLYEKAMEVSVEVNAGYVWLGVWEENQRAISFYKKNGFIEFDKHIFKLGDDEQTDVMMKKKLEAMSINMQPTLQSESLILYPLHQKDFMALYTVAADPGIWAQHPNKDRWKSEVFKTFFEGAMQSGGAFRVVEKATGQTIGSTRFYDYNDKDGSIFIGYTFYGRGYWGRGINPMVKALMLNYIFRFVDRVFFHIGAGNIRSQVAISNIGAVKVAEQEVAYFGEMPKLNFVYEITKVSWAIKQSAYPDED
jgi:RimJ/RimL family protein N-acetyltransferase